MKKNKQVIERAFDVLKITLFQSQRKLFCFRLLLLSLLLIIYSDIKSQDCTLPTDSFHSISRRPHLSSSCNNDNSNTNPVYINKYKPIATYIPDNNTPIKHININVNCFTGGTIYNNSATIAAINQMVAWINGFYTNIVPASYPIPGVVPLTDTKIRFDLDNRIYFYDGTSLYNSNSLGTLQSYVAGVDPTRLNNLNIYITNGGTPHYAIAPYPVFMLIDGYSTPTSLYGDQGVYMNCMSSNQFSPFKFKSKGVIVVNNNFIYS